MFRSRSRDIIIPQAEHARLAGAAAAHWGNSRFERPACSFDSFLAAVHYHDRCYGQMDEVPVDTVADEAWVAMERAAVIDSGMDDPLAQALIMLHVKRLCGYKESTVCRDFAHELESKLRHLVLAHGLVMKDLERADRVVALCDALSFNFCFEEAASRSELVYPRRTSEAQIGIEVEVREGGIIEVEPWPFAAESFHGYIMGYTAEDYPDDTNPVPVHYYVQHRR